MTDDTHHFDSTETDPDGHQQAREAAEHAIDALCNDDLSHAHTLLDEAQVAVERAHHDDSGTDTNPVANPFAINPPADLPADAAPLRDAEAHISAMVMKHINDLTGRQRDDLRSIVRFTIKETYKRRGFAHTHTTSPAELRDRQDPTPEDFPDTLEDIITDTEQYVESSDSLSVEVTKESATRLFQLLPEAEDWENAASVTESDRHQRHRREESNTTAGIGGGQCG